MKLKLIVMLLFSFTLNSYCQSKIINKLAPGKYDSNNESHNNPHHYEEITLHGDGKFDYFLQMNEFVQIKKKGEWIIREDTLILNEDNPSYKTIMTVDETFDRKIYPGFIKFDVLEFDQNSFRYEISATHIDTTITVSNLEKPSLIHLQSVDYFNISSAEFEYPTYNVNNSKMNHFIVHVSPRPSFVEEKWLIINGKIRPKGTNGLNAGYFLEITH
jgi:hypothetical protein